jgi:hypothetical protein
MNYASIPVAEYRALALQFNPTSFSARDIVALAKAAGMKYIVITARHHDGFAMFDSKANSFNIVAATPFRRDPLRELAEECRKQGMKPGFYQSGRKAPVLQGGDIRPVKAGSFAAQRIAGGWPAVPRRNWRQSKTATTGHCSNSVSQYQAA